MANQGLLKTSLARKYAMALSALFLLFFLLQHMSINLLSVFSPDAFNEVSHFMGTNGLVQAVLQPVLFLGVIFHFVMGFILELQNRSARTSSYAKYAGGTNASWVSRNMIITGVVILLFLFLHLYDFWVHEMTVKYAGNDMSGLIDQNNPDSGFRYYKELVEKFKGGGIWRMALYIISFVFLGLHLNHGFSSAFQSMGARSKKYTPLIKNIGLIYSIAVPALFVFIAVFHYTSN